jgi:hypothetical protein
MTHISMSFLSELVQVCEKELLPMLLGGYFNILHKQEEK